MKTKNMAKITSKTTLEKILEIKGAEEVLAKYNVPCLSCPMAGLELNQIEIGDVGKLYKLETKKIINELNRLI